MRLLAKASGLAVRLPEFYCTPIHFTEGPYILLRKILKANRNFSVLKIINFLSRPVTMKKLRVEMTWFFSRIKAKITEILLPFILA